ncbi:protein BOLA4, chloroplastic/mitochondrial [Diospyros lotus]|uniref:protein BOLA4, chloroplastic/mitochondrial n=1 Tax=Diospyros lotus TaxID=55363 RepID=UPI0022579475|nr:protein BOLA4, chloroplastic/mitochondrial [Diospyros lotus]
MAMAVLMRPHMAALCALRVNFFSSRALVPCFQSSKLCCYHVTARCVLPSPARSCGTKNPRSGGFGSKLDSRRSLCIRATTQVNDSGSVDSPLIQSMEKKIKEHLNAESVIVKDAYGDGRHVSIDVVSSAFEGQSAVNRQRMVYRAIWEELQNTVHAVDQMTTRTPAEAASGK